MNNFVKMKLKLLPLILVVSFAKCHVQDAKEETVVFVNKCCEEDEIMVDNACTNVNETKTTQWRPLFTSEDGKSNIDVKFQLVIGDPKCGSTQQWPILHYQNSPDVLSLLPTGVLRHIAYHGSKRVEDLDDHIIEPGTPGASRTHDYQPGHYCMDKSYDTSTDALADFSLVCAPDMPVDQTSTDFLMRKILDPLFHSINIASYLTVAIIYFILPTLRDLVGNIVTTMSVCLILSQAADMVRIFTELTSHVSFMIADVFCYTSLIAAFFWLNSLGYYIWRTFRSRNVFLRVTDARKYCRYGLYAWSCTLVMGLIAVGAHFMLETPQARRAAAVSLLHRQEILGSLAMAVFFTPVALTVLVNIFFYATTMQILNRMTTYGRIHDKLRHSFRMFVLILLIMTVSWLFMMLSWLKFDTLMYVYIGVNALHGPLFLYVCIWDQKHVSTLLKKTCCVSGGHGTMPTDLDWGDEMTAMNNY